MIVVLKSTATEADIALMETKIRAWDLTPSFSRGSERNVVGVLGDERDVPATATLMEESPNDCCGGRTRWMVRTFPAHRNTPYIEPSRLIRRNRI